MKMKKEHRKVVILMAEEMKNENGGEEELDNLFTLTDEEGNESQFELIGELTLDGQDYLALLPVEQEESEDDEYVILKVTSDENGEELLVTIDDDDEFDRVADAFEDQFMGEMDLDEAQGDQL